MTTHTLKTIPPYFAALYNREKTFELRKNDRGFAVGDKLILKEYVPGEDFYTGNELHAEITYILEIFPGLSDGYAALGIKLTGGIDVVSPR